MEYSKQKLMENIYALIQERGIKIGELENELGVSTGYISRLNKNPDSTINIELVLNIANYFGVSIDVLVEGDMTKVRDNLHYMGQFINSLKDATDSNKLEWDSIYIDDVNKDLRSTEPPKLFMIEEDDDRVYGTDSKPYEYQGQKCSLSALGKKVLTSAAAPHETVMLTGTAYKTEMSAGTELYIFPMLALLDTPNGGVEEEYFDLYMRKWELEKDWDPSYGSPTEQDFQWYNYPLCNTLNNAGEIETQIALLYRAIARHEGDLKIDNSVRKSMEAFMGRM